MKRHLLSRCPTCGGPRYDSAPRDYLADLPFAGTECKGCGVTPPCDTDSVNLSQKETS